MKSRSRRSKPPALPPPSTIEDGAKRLGVAAVQVFDRLDGTGADWRLMVESMFKAAFSALDKLPEDDRRRIAGRAHEGAYNRLAGNPEASNREALESAATAKAAFSAVFGAPTPKGPR